MARARRVTPTVSGLSGLQGAQPVTNLTVTGTHTYRVGAAGALVHNCGPTPDLDALSASGARQVRPDGLTRAGQELAKHKSEGSFPAPTGSPTTISKLAQDQLDDILTSPGTRVEPITGGQFVGGQYFIAPDGRGAAFDRSCVASGRAWMA